MAGNPRIDELRKKLDKEPGSRLFAQLAEELRKDGDLEDAIRVAREPRLAGTSWRVGISPPFPAGVPALGLPNNLRHNQG